MADWQPIETAPRDGKAPRDGTVFLAYLGNGEVMTARWCGACKQWEESEGSRRLQPLCWQPLPAPPSEGDQQ